MMISFNRNVVDFSSLRHSSPSMSQTELPREFVAHHTVQSSVESCRLGAKLAETRWLLHTHTHTHTLARAESGVSSGASYLTIILGHLGHMT